MNKNLFLQEIALYVPEEERIGASHQISVVENLRGKLNDFEAALDLITHIDSEIARIISERAEFLKNLHLKELENRAEYLKYAAHRLHYLARWPRLARRDAAMTIFHFGSLLDGINFKNCPTIGRNINNPEIRSARYLFKKHFPDHIDVRNSLAHSGENSADYDRSTKHFTDAGIENGFFPSHRESLFESVGRASMTAWRQHIEASTIKKRKSNLSI